MIMAAAEAVWLVYYSQEEVRDMLMFLQRN